MQRIGFFSKKMVPNLQHNNELPIIHVGFGHSGTTSLQANIFSRHPEIFYFGINQAGRVPYDKLGGGVFSEIKYRESRHYNERTVRQICEDLILKSPSKNKRLLLSDETFVEQPAIYHTPAMQPLETVAERLYNLFGKAQVLFTIRSQFDYVISNYNVLKKNYETLDNQKLEPFSAWFTGNQSQVRNLFLRNLDYSDAIRVYQKIFGKDMICVLPLEIIRKEGVHAYFSRLTAATGLKIPADFLDCYVPRNVSDNHDIRLDSCQIDFIQEKSANGNAWISREFNLPLEDLDYPFPRSWARIFEHRLGRHCGPS